MTSRNDALVAFASAIGHDFADPALLDRALTHRSVNVSGREGDNQRLEFLGDRVLGLSVAAMLYRRFPDAREGELARRHAALVSRPALVEIARRIDLGPHLRATSGEQSLDSSLEDACEALIGALFLDGGIEAADRFIAREWESLLGRDVASVKDAKSRLQEWSQGRGSPIPSYDVVAQEGADHAPHFTVRVSVGKHSADGEGPSRRTAEQAAAAILLTRLGDSV